MNGGDFERLITGHRSGGRSLVERFKGERSDFSNDMQAIICLSEESLPPTQIGKSLYDLLKHQFERRGIKTEGFILRSTVNTKVDAHHFTDMVAYLPSMPDLPITIDFFSISSCDLDALRSLWARDSKARVYSQLDEQTNIFLFKEGLSVWRKEKGIIPRADLSLFRRKIGSVPDWAQPVPFWDFRRFAVGIGRPENHFILTPYHIETSERRKNFANMIADYLLQAFRHNTAQQSH